MVCTGTMILQMLSFGQGNKNMFNKGYYFISILGC